MGGLNMSNLGIRPPTNAIVFGGKPFKIIQKIETATNCYPGRLVIKGTNDDDVKVGDGVSTPMGWLGYDQADPEHTPDNITSIYAANAQAPVHFGSGFLRMPSGLAAKTIATKNDFLLSWGDGQVVPAAYLGGRLAVKIPFSKSTTEAQTVTLPAGAVVRDVVTQVVTNAESATIDVGTLSTDSGDADGFLDGESCATAGFVQHNNYDAGAANNTVGALLVEADITGDVAAGYYSIPTGYLVPSGGKVLTYTTSDHTVAGFIFVVIESPGIIPVGKTLLSANASSAAVDVCLECLI